MSPEPENVSGKVCKESLGSLSGCLVDGDPEQLARERRTRRRALAVSIGLQSAVLTLLVLIPLFGKTERIVMRDYIPVPPYGHVSNHPRSNENHTTSRPTNPDSRFTFHAPTTNVNAHPVEDPNPIGPSDFGSPENHATNGPGCSWCVDLGGKDAGPRPPQPPTEVRTKPRVVQVTQLDPAMLIHRVEPVYPRLAVQTRRDGRVELRAIIGTDGTIQSLQIVVSDPLFDRSALEAVGQWRYRPTVLNGQPVEIDTYITVIYSTQH
jgi:TonB family protein